MENINLTQRTYVDRNAVLYFNALGVKDLKLTTKVVPVNKEQVPVVHLEGVQISSGIYVNVDMFPRDHAKAEDIKALPKTLDNIRFRIGYYPSIDENGESTLREGMPKWVSYFVGEKEIKLSGEKREFSE